MGVLRPGGEIVATRSASEVAIELIRAAIYEGRLEPGERLKEEELAQELGLSRTPVREALLTLQAEGLVLAAPKRGAVVRTYTEEDLIDMYDLRAVLEGFAARRAAQRITAEQLATLDRTNDQFRALRKKRDLFGMIRENLLFHTTIAEAAGTTKLTELIRSAVDLPLVYRSFFWFSAKETETSELAHREIADALHAADPPRAERLMREHIDVGRDFLVERVRTGSLSSRRNGVARKTKVEKAKVNAGA
jgi:DNA-binding GntR family transcriptional regulator